MKWNQYPSRTEDPSKNTAENESLSGDDRSIRPITRRDTLKRVGSLTAASVTGLAGGPAAIGIAAASETLSDTNVATDGDHSKRSPVGCGKEAELTTCSALYEDATPYDKGRPLTVYWGAQEVDPDTKAYLEMKDLTVTVEITNTSDAGDAWTFTNAHWSQDKAPVQDAYEPSFSDGVSLFVFSVGLSFSASGTANQLAPGLEKTSYNFEEVIDGSTGPYENQGWLRVNFENPSESDPSTDIQVDTTVDCTVEYHNSGPGPCGSYSNGETINMSVGESFDIKITK